MAMRLRSPRRRSGRHKPESTAASRTRRRRSMATSAADEQRPAEVPVEEPGHDRAEGDQLAVGEVHEARGAEDQRQADRAHRDDQAEVHALDRAPAGTGRTCPWSAAAPPRSKSSVRAWSGLTSNSRVRRGFVERRRPRAACRCRGWRRSRPAPGSSITNLPSSSVVSSPTSSPSASSTTISTPSTGSSSSASRCALLSTSVPWTRSPPLRSGSLDGRSTSARRRGVADDEPASPTATRTAPAARPSEQRATPSPMAERRRSRGRYVGAPQGARRCSIATPTSLEDLVERRDQAGVERAELGVDRRRLVEAHRVDDVLQVVGVHAEQRDAPLVVVEAGRAGDDLEDRGRRTCGPVAPCPYISSLRSSYGQREPVLARRRAASTSGRSRTPASPRAAAAGTGGPASSPRARPGAYSDTSVSDTYESTTSSPAAASSVWNRRSRHRSGPSAMNAEVGLVAEHGHGDDLVVVALRPPSPRRRSPRRRPAASACRTGGGRPSRSRASAAQAWR